MNKSFHCNLVKVIFSVFSVTFLFTQSFAQGDVIYSELIGFSQDGKYLAYEEYSYQVESEFGRSTVYIVNVDSNKYVTFISEQAKQDNTGDDPSEDTFNNFFQPIRKTAIRNSADLFKKYTIKTTNKGTRVYSDSCETEEFSGTKNNDVLFTIKPQTNKERTWKLELKEFEVSKEKNEATCYDDGDASLPQPKIFELTLESGNEKIILQKDERLPKSRGCVCGYGIHEVYIYKNRIAVFLHYYPHCYMEGGTDAKMIVTGIIN